MAEKIETTDKKGKTKILWVTDLVPPKDATEALAHGCWGVVNFSRPAVFNYEEGRLECTNEEDVLKFEEEYHG